MIHPPVRSTRDNKTVNASPGKSSFEWQAPGTGSGRVTTQVLNAEAAQNLKMDEGAVRVAVHRLCKRYRELFRDEIAQTLDDPAQVAEELRSLQAALAG